jgi:hypothetical protein
MTAHPNRPIKLPRIVRGSRSWTEFGEEPSLAEVMADPIVHLVMARDHLTHADVESAVALGRRQLRSRLCRRCAA